MLREKISGIRKNDLGPKGGIHHGSAWSV